MSFANLIFFAVVILAVMGAIGTMFLLSRGGNR